MQRRWRFVWFGALLSACAPAEPAPPAHTGLGAAPPVGRAAVQAQAVQPQECEAVTSIEIVHRVGSAQVTDKVRLDPRTSADPGQALRGFQRAADYFGQHNIVRTRPITEVMCFPAATATEPESGPAPAAHTRSNAAAVASAGGQALCANGSVVYFCDDPTPANRYDYNDGGSCTVSSYGDAASFSCDDSGLIVSRRGDVVMTVNTEHVRQEVLARTQALRRLVGDANVLTNFHFNIAISPDQRAALVDNAAFGRIAQQIQQASQLQRPLPDIPQLLHDLPHQPTNVAFFEQLEKAYQTRQERLELLAKITNAAQLSPAQVHAFYQQFVGKSQLVDKLLVERTATSLKQAAGQLNDTIEQLASTSPLSTIYEQVKAVSRAVLESNTTCGVFDPDHVVSFVPAELYKFLTDEDIQKRQIAATRLIRFNEKLRTSGAQKLAEATIGLLGLLASAMDKNDMDRVWRIYDQVEATEFFVEGGDPRGTRFDVHLTDQARTMFRIDVAPTSAAAYDVITVLNEVADYNARTGKITVDYQAVITLNARAALRTSDAIRALYHTEEAYNTLDVAKGFLGGILDDFGSTASGIFHMATHPWETYEGLKAAIINWDQTLAMVWQQGAELIHRWPDMTPVEKADFMGHLAAQILTTLPSEARQAGRLDEALQEAVKLHLDEANLGLRVAERAGVSLAPEAASELARRMEQLGVTALDDMVELADELDDYMPCRLVGSGPGLRVGVLSVKPPCSAIQISQILESLGLQSRALGLKDAQLADGIVASAKVGLRSIGVDLWESKAGLRYGDDRRYGNRVLHVLHHAVDDPTRTKPHGVFDTGRRGVLKVVDEGWRKALVESSSDVQIIPQNGGRLRYEINMHRRIGFVGGAPGAAAGHPEATYLAIIVEKGRNIVTAYPFRK